MSIEDDLNLKPGPSSECPIAHGCECDEPAYRTIATEIFGSCWEREQGGRCACKLRGIPGLLGAIYAARYPFGAMKPVAGEQEFVRVMIEEAAVK